MILIYNNNNVIIIIIGYDSVEGLVGPNLNYDEVVVYDNHQVMPAYLIVYTLPPT